MRCVLPGGPGGPGIPSLPSRPKRNFTQSVIISAYLSFQNPTLPLTKRSTKYTAPSSAESGGGRFSINEGMVHSLIGHFRDLLCLRFRTSQC